MYTRKLTNPETGREVAVRCWDLDRRQVLQDANAAMARAAAAGQGERFVLDKHISWSLLNDRQATRTMERTLDGDSARSNFALATLEQALDWRIGGAVLGFIRAGIAQNKRIRYFTVAVARSGKIFIIVPRKDGGPEWVTLWSA